MKYFRYCDIINFAVLFENILRNNSTLVLGDNMGMFLSVVNENYTDTFDTFIESVKHSFANFSIIDAIDILLLSILLFVGFNFFKSRKAGALLFGVAVMITLTVISSIFGFKSLSYIFNGVLKIGVLALVIIFQPEIRDALEKVGSGSLSGIMNIREQKNKKMIYSKSIEQICAAVKDLSATKTGALIVLSRTTKLDEITETGITINADVNSFLIRNLFFNKAPLHDGAVVVDEGKIIAAGCLLPLTRRTDIDGNLGTRHRAAIGMSETSDAIIVVVSEETGTISVAYDCTLTRDYTEDSLRKFLLQKIFKITQDEENN